jgi:hypothetical protein
MQNIGLAYIADGNHFDEVVLQGMPGRDDGLSRRIP